MNRASITIGTRGSALARWQAEHIAQRLRDAFPGLHVNLRIIKTKGDKILDVPLAKVGGKGLFVKEIEEALKRCEVDLAVHSIKDVPTELVEGLTLSCIPQREDPRDALAVTSPNGLAADGESCPQGSSRPSALLALPQGSRVGTSSLRRRCQLLNLRSDLQILDLRGNVDTRLARLAPGHFDAVVLAAAGLKRLGHGHRATEIFPPELMLPAVGQGALGIETRLDDREVNEIVAVLHHEPTACCVRAERSMLGRLGGGCQVPIAGHARLEGEILTLDGLIGHPSGKPLYREQRQGNADSPEALGVAVAEGLLAQGADNILKEVYSETSPAPKTREAGVDQQKS